MSEWIKYDGSDEQIEEIDSGDNDILFRLENGKVMFEREVNGYWWKPFVGVTDYLICQPHPYADLIKIWADTGCPVWVRPTKPYEFKISDYENHPTTKLMVDHRGVYLITTAPDWNIPGAEYRLTPFED